MGDERRAGKARCPMQNRRRRFGNRISFSAALLSRFSRPWENRRDNFESVFSSFVLPRSIEWRQERERRRPRRQRFRGNEFFREAGNRGNRRDISVRAESTGTRAREFSDFRPVFPPSVCSSPSRSCIAVSAMVFPRNYYPATATAAPVGSSGCRNQRRYRFPLTATNSNFARIANVNWPPE